MWLGALGDEELVFDRERRGSVDSAGASRGRGDELLSERGGARARPKVIATGRWRRAGWASVCVLR